MEPNNLLDRLIERLEERLDRIELKIDKLDDRIDSADKTLVKQEENLKLHMRRSDNLEKLIEIQQNRVVPLEKHVTNVRFLLKAVTWTLGTIGGVLAVLSSFKII